MSLRIRVEHRSRYRYATPVDSSFNELRITPLTTPRQAVLDSRLQVSPPVDLYPYVDYWGSVVYAFDLHEAHDELTIVGRSLVETFPFDRPTHPPLKWGALPDRRVLDRYAELLSPTRYVPVDPRLAVIAEELKVRSSPPETVAAALAWVRDQLKYVPGTTGVHTSALEAWNGGVGVCQDFAHLSLAVIRAMGLPARYCSGYMYPAQEVEVGETEQGESHAWIEVWSGDWLAVDPTAGNPVDGRYVLVARGRDYADVAPVKGIFHGGPTAQLDVEVSLTRTA
jgi:transglutaminase-like putative cysteine protease